ncbi:MAG: Stk1 family PASTA domain-containing Ser/Thr kinase [Bifidobacteriaceae bacterium]|nr:Stk1 family PASTA domain-containing Ser/Thr kinase [Bifidobacteriaceae bacterium]
MASTPTDSLLGLAIDGRYRIDARLARGGMATVYQATDLRLDRPVAVKVLHPHLAEGPQFVDRFRREARAAARLIDPGIVAVYDQGTWGEAPYLVMELVDGPNLRRLLALSGLPTVGKALDLMIQVLQALAVAHAAGFVHRDIKPENILITRTGQIKVADFGLARAVSEVTAASSGVVLGTVAYLSPELIAQGTADKRADVYAAGVVLFELLTGTQPYVADAPIQVAFQHVHSDFPAPSTRVAWLPQEVDSLVMALTAKQPERRPEDAAAALALIRAVREALPGDVAARAASFEPPAPDAAEAQAAFVSPPAVPSPPAAGEAGEAGGAEAGGGPGPAGGPGAERTVLVAVGAGGDSDTDPFPAGGAGGPGGGTGGTQALPLARIPPAAPPAPASGQVTGERRPWRRHRALWWLVAALLALGGGGGVLYWYFGHGPGSLVAVPQVAGEVLASADAALAAGELASRVAAEFSDDVPDGVVISSDPEAGERVKPGSIVDLVVSKGVRPAVIPATGIVGAAVADARAALAQAGLDGEVEQAEVYDTTVPAGVVIAVEPEGGSEVAHNHPLKLVLSKGPEPVDAPDLRDLTLTDAVQAAARFELTVVEGEPEYSDTVAEGLIVSQTPAPLAGTHRGAEVTVVLSLGRPYVEVPKLTGQTYDDAVAKLTELDLVPERNAPLGELLGLVQAQTPAAGESVRKGSTVKLTVV